MQHSPGTGAWRLARLVCSVKKQPLDMQEWRSSPRTVENVLESTAVVNPQTPERENAPRSRPRQTARGGGCRRARSRRWRRRRPLRRHAAGAGRAGAAAGGARRRGRVRRGQTQSAPPAACCLYAPARFVLNKGVGLLRVADDPATHGPQHDPAATQIAWSFRTRGCSAALDT